MTEKSKDSLELMQSIDQALGDVRLCTYLIILFVALLISLLIRIVSADLKARESRRQEGLENAAGAPAPACCSQSIYRSLFWRHFSGKEDMGLPFFIGVLELFFYPILMKADAVGVIGGWIGIKALGNWSGWERSRPLYNIYLLGTVATVIGSYVVYRMFL